MTADDARAALGLAAYDEVTGWLERIAAERDALKTKVKRFRSAARLRWREEWHDDVGNVLWFSVPVNEPPFHVGTPHDSDWPSSIASEDLQIAWCEIPDLSSDLPDDAGGGA